jgi:hypothetical protein
MRSVYRNAGIDPKDAGYVEAHGTGTKVGDPIEASALHNIFGEGRSARNPLFIGSVKSNIGHLEAASGKAWTDRDLVESKLTVLCRNYFGDQNCDDAGARLRSAKLRFQEPKRKDPLLSVALESM